LLHFVIPEVFIGNPVFAFYTLSGFPLKTCGNDRFGGIFR